MGRSRRKRLDGVVEEAAHGRLDAAHHALHAVGRAQEVRLVDDVRAAGADDDVLGVIGHAHHFVRHDLADRKDEIIPGEQELVHLDAHAVIHQPAGPLLNQLAGHLADLPDAVAPIMHLEPCQRDALAEHHAQLRLGHRRVRAERGHDVHLGLGREQLVEQARQLPGIGVEPGMVGRQHQHLAQRTADDLQGLGQRLPLLSGADAVRYPAACKVCCHVRIRVAGRRTAPMAVT